MISRLNLHEFRTNRIKRGQPKIAIRGVCDFYYRGISDAVSCRFFRSRPVSPV